jgi:hypothetical protein
MKAPSVLIGPTFLLLAAIIWLIPESAWAQVKEMNAQELALESSSILYGKCIKTESAWTEDRKMILTTVTIVPEYYLKGNLGSEISITVPGGQVDNIIYEVSEMPAFRKGEEVFAFIWKHPSGMNLVTGGYRGKMKVSVDPKTGKKTVSGRALRKATPERIVQEPSPKDQAATKTLEKTTLSKTKSERISLDDFTKEVEGYLNQR